MRRLGDLRTPSTDGMTAAQIEAERSNIHAIQVDETWGEFLDAALSLRAAAPSAAPG